MKATGKQSKNTRKSSRSALSNSELALELIKAKDKHLSDLRVLLDRQAEHSQQLANMLERQLEGRQSRPVVTSNTENRIEAALPAEILSDVEVFDEKADAADVKKQELSQAEAERELRNLWTEQMGLDETPATEETVEA